MREGRLAINNSVVGRGAFGPIGSQSTQRNSIQRDIARLLQKESAALNFLASQFGKIEVDQRELLNRFEL